MFKSYLTFIFLLFLMKVNGYYELHQVRNCDHENCFECDIEFKVYDNGALQVNFKNPNGFEVAGFHGNVNRGIQFGEIGDINFDLNKSKRSNIWKYTIRNAFLERYNEIRYWVYIQKNGQQIFCDRLKTRIEEIDPSPFAKVTQTTQNQSVQNNLNNHCPPCNCQGKSTGHATASATATATMNINVHNRQPVSNTVNRPITPATGRPHAISPTAPACNPPPAQTTDSLCDVVDLISTITKLENAQATIESLMEVIEQLKGESQANGVKGLKLFYQMSKPPLPHQDPVNLIKSVIVDNLDMIDLENEIAQASFIDGGILFEVKKTIDKMRILYRAKQMLANSKNKIIDPEISNNNNNGVNIAPNILSTTTKKYDNFNELANNVFGSSSTTEPSSNSDIDESFWRSDDTGIRVPTKVKNV
ncbi:uncharacterized protein LOC129615269 [Condylostylus longicornis]|uniref:uncharacterized protein LOC129615269 n=1 Tax=Condylostylus longicornis TaxID=2530218 RepID=UPI00244DF2F6|nr:uncharacterized protein LOC129615269 [Condylostylus longicornis]